MVDGKPWSSGLSVLSFQDYIQVPHPPFLILKLEFWSGQQHHDMTWHDKQMVARRVDFLSFHEQQPMCSNAKVLSFIRLQSHISVLNFFSKVKTRGFYFFFFFFFFFIFVFFFASFSSLPLSLSIPYSFLNFSFWICLLLLLFSTLCCSFFPPFHSRNSQICNWFGEIFLALSLFSNLFTSTFDLVCNTDTLRFCCFFFIYLKNVWKAHMM